MATKKDLSALLNQRLFGERIIHFERLNKESLKLLIDSLPYKPEEREVNSLEKFKEIVADSRREIVKYSVPLGEPTLVLKAVKDGIVYGYSEYIRPQLRRIPSTKGELEQMDTYAVFEILGENVELVVSPEEITIEEAKERNKEKISDLIEEKIPNATPGKIELEEGGERDD